jgi:alkylation response protein AidB-like acyl-CoA dehydrogenase
MEYKADMRDVKFVLFEMLKAQDLSKHELYSEANRELLEMVVDEGYNFAREVLAPSFETGDREGCQFEGGKVTMHKDIIDGYKQWGENGWGGMIESPEYDGQGLPLVMASVVNEFFTGANCALSLLPMLTVGAAHLIEQFAPDFCKENTLRKLYSLEWAGTMCLTEPQAGSDVGASKSKASPVGDGTYKIVGTKNFITGGDHNATENIIHLVLARIDGAPKGTRGLSLFMIPKYRINDDGSMGEYNDVTCAGIEHKMGIHGTPTCTINFGDNDDCFGYLVGKEHSGMKLMFHLMNEARVWVGMQGLAIASCSYQQALIYAGERLQGPDIREFKNPDAAKAPIVRHPDVRRMLMSMKAWTEAMRSLFLTVAWMEDKMRVAENEEEKAHFKGLVDLLTPICKAYGSDIGFELTATGIQILGGYGYCKEFPHEQLLRDSKIASIYEGSNGIQAMDLFARKVASKGGALFRAYIGEIDKFLKENAGQRECIEDILTALDAAKKVLVRTTGGLGVMAHTNLSGALLQATPYLRQFGHVACAFELSKQVVVAHDKLREIYDAKGVETKEQRRELYETNADANFYRSKTYVARWFANNVLPEVEAISKAVLSKDTAPLDVLFSLEEEA